MAELFSTGTLPLSDIFPLVTICDLTLRTMGMLLLLLVLLLTPSYCGLFYSGLWERYSGSGHWACQKVQCLKKVICDVRKGI